MSDDAQAPGTPDATAHRSAPPGRHHSPDFAPSAAPPDFARPDFAPPAPLPGFATPDLVPPAPTPDLVPSAARAELAPPSARPDLVPPVVWPPPAGPAAVFAGPRRSSPASPAAGVPVPPPPIAPDGPGRLPYGYLGAYAYPAPPPPGWYDGFEAWPPPSNGQGTAALVTGILSTVGFFLSPLSLLAGAVAVVLGVLGRRRVLRDEATNRGQALAGIICGATGVVLGAAMLVYYLSP
ncbi:DUF4190 domain-containing protein [Streptomyces mangrovisoli]|nr:DUF4190 domain-containing protein [Streptomyces mangrovisoli]